MKVLPRNQVEHPCAPCESATQGPDTEEWRRWRRAIVWDGHRDLREPRRKTTKEKWG